jgi:hypothetical protein
VEIHVLPARAAGALGAHRRAGSAFLDSEAFAKAAPLYDAVICLRLGAREAPLSTLELLSLAGARDIQLCGVLSRKPYVSKNAKLYGLPLPQAQDAADATKDKTRRSLVVVGIRSPKGELAGFPAQKAMIAQLFREGRIAKAEAGGSLQESGGRELRYLEVKGGRLPHKLKPDRRAAPRLAFDDMFPGIEAMIVAESVKRHGRRAHRHAHADCRPNRPVADARPNAVSSSKDHAAALRLGRRLRAFSACRAAPR